MCFACLMPVPARQQAACWQKVWSYFNTTHVSGSARLNWSKDMHMLDAGLSLHPSVHCHASMLANKKLLLKPAICRAPTDESTPEDAMLHRLSHPAMAVGNAGFIVIHQALQEAVGPPRAPLPSLSHFCAFSQHGQDLAACLACQLRECLQDLPSCSDPAY